MWVLISWPAYSEMLAMPGHFLGTSLESIAARGPHVHSDLYYLCKRPGFAERCHFLQLCKEGHLAHDAQDARDMVPVDLIAHLHPFSEEQDCSQRAAGQEEEKPAHRKKLI